MPTKTFTAPFELKADGEPGRFRAVFATLNVVDLHGDITVPGAFDEQNVIIEPWNHGWDLPAGKAVIMADENEAWVEGEFFLDTAAGKENYQTVKNLGSLAEWSYTFQILDQSPADPAKFAGADRILRKLDVVGVGPVTRGAGIDTRTVDIKTAGKDATDTEGEAASTGSGQAGDGKPSGIGPQVVLTQIEIIELEI